tara:strand:+ start:368 stop:1669 length:1302 start_codon:yes stop_codon:yes gene_type:complete
MINIGVIGLGYVGLTLSIVAAKKGFTVYGIDKENSILESLRKKKAHFYEKDLDTMLSEVYDKNFFISDSFSKDKKIECFVITVGTPLANNSKKPNIDYIVNALKSISKIYDGSQLIILRSTVSVGTTREIVINELSRISNKKKEDILIAFCPERTIEGNALNELVEIPQIIGPNNDRSFEMAEVFFKNITNNIIRVESLEAAELIKLFNNTYRDIHFSIGNYFNLIAQSFGIRGERLIKAANYKYPRSNIASPGLVGGPCLEKDPYILVNNMNNSEGKDFVLGARSFNESMENRIVEWIKRNKLKHKINNIGISGLAFKGNPDNSDLRGSSSINIIQKLKANSIVCRLHDYIVSEPELAVFGNASNHFESFTEELEMLVILNNNHRYNFINLQFLQKNMNSPHLVFDCWSTISLESEESKLKITTLGNMELDK